MTFTRRHAGAAVAVAAVLAIATPFVANFEGFRSRVYPDPATKGAPWSYCYGETARPQFGHTYSRAECNAALAGTLAKTDAGVRACIRAPLPIKAEAAFVSTAYNIGIAGLCNSSIARKANAGDLAGACNVLPQFNHAAGKVMAGLTVRRGAERDLCLEGVKEGIPK